MGCKNLGGNSSNNNSDYYPDINMHRGMGIMSVAAAAAAHQAAMQYHHRLPPHPRAMINPSHQHQQQTAATTRQYGMVNNGTNNNNNGLPPRQPYHQHHSTPSTSHSVWNDPMSAAESLTFLKHGSPSKINAGSTANHQSDRPYTMGVSPITKSPGTLSSVPENVSMPSLASSSEGESPGDNGVDNRLRVAATPESFRGESSALFLAAVAMTEFGQSPPPTSSMLSPDFIRNYSTDNGNDDDDENIIGIGDTGLTPDQQRRRTSKRSINFDEITDSDTKEAKSRRRMS
jgi:hypothetical protein